MNSLSWMIYAAGAVGNLSQVAVLVAVFGSMLGGACFAFGKAQEVPQLAMWGKRTAIIALVAAIIAIFTPTSNTIYAIAASEMGEEVLISETGGKAVEALNAWLDRQIAGEDQ